MEKKLPIGVQKFQELIQGGYLYVDKTQIIHRLIQTGKYYFLSRPRRFGKSLLVSTINEIFKGNQELFKGLWIHDRIEWVSRPVIYLDFSEILSKNTPLEVSLSQELDRIAEDSGVTLQAQSSDQKFRELIETLGQIRKVAILVDEYDKPIINYIHEPEMAEKNREELKNLYSVVKGNDHLIEFFLLTGVSKFSHVSIFSDLNNLYDITIGKEFSELLGYTENELRKYFEPNIRALQEEYKEGFPNIYLTIRDWYNGYSWDGRHFVYNPFSILNLFRKQVFQDYWFSTGTPTFLMKLLRQRNYSAYELKDRKLDVNYFNKFEITNIEVNSLLFQTGYLTLKDWDRVSNIVTLDFPNREVEQSFNIHLLAEFSGHSKEQAGSILYQLGRALEAGDTDHLIVLLKEMYEQITYPNIEKRESYFHSIFYMCLKLLGYNIQSEVLTLRGRIDAVIQTPDYVYVIEFKIGDAASALDQIKEKKYHLKYAATGKKIVLLGIGFDAGERNIGSYLVEEAN